MREVTVRALRAMGLDPAEVVELAREVERATRRVPEREQEDARQHILISLHFDTQRGQRALPRLRMRAWSAMRDYGRSRDMLTRGQRAFVRRAEAAACESAREAPALDAGAREGDVAGRLGLTVVEYRRRRREAAMVVGELTEAVAVAVPAEAEAAVLRGELGRVVDRLEGRERLVIEHELAGGDQVSLAGALGVHTSRVCQIRRRAIVRLRESW